MDSAVYVLLKSFLQRDLSVLDNISLTNQWSVTVQLLNYNITWFSLLQKVNKNSSEDEIANENIFTTISHTYFEIPKKEPTSFSKLNDS